MRATSEYSKTLRIQASPPPPQKMVGVEAFGQDPEGAGPHSSPAWAPGSKDKHPGQDGEADTWERPFCFQFTFSWVKAQSWQKHSRKSTKLSRSLIPELGSAGPWPRVWWRRARDKESGTCGGERVLDKAGKARIGAWRLGVWPSPRVWWPLPSSAAWRRFLWKSRFTC